MIGWLNGRIVDRPETGKLVIEAQGVGYDVETSLHTFFQLEPRTDNICLHIHTIVREDALLLYGFLEKQERFLFRTLIKVNGVGPKVAMSILSSTTPAEFISCIQTEQTEQLIRLPGIGKKTAERLVVEMKDKLAHFSPSISSTAASSSPNLTAQAEAISALEALGYKPHEAAKMVKAVAKENDTCEQLIRLALRVK